VPSQGCASKVHSAGTGSCVKLVYTIDPLKDARWTPFVHTHPHASIFHTRGWLDALRRTYGYRPVAFTTSDPGGPLSNALLFARVSSWLTGRRIVSLPFSDHCQPLFHSNDHLQDVLTYLQTETACQRWGYVEIRPVNGTMSGFHPVASYRMHRINLEPSLDEIFQTFDKDSVRRRICRAERAGLLEKHGQSEDLLGAFYKLLILTRRRHRLPPQPYVWFRNLVQSLGDAAEVRVAYTQEQQPIAAILNLRFKDALFYKYGCSDTRYKNLGAMPFLFWRAIQDAKGTGANEFDLGRSDEDNPGLVAFKDAWTKSACRLVYWRFPPSPAHHVRSGWAMRVARLLFAHLPNRALTTAGELVYPHMG